MSGMGGMSGGGDDARQQWKTWHENRVATVSEPYGPLALTGTHWLADAVDGRLETLDGTVLPGRWTEGAAGDDTIVLSATAADGLTLDGRPLDGEVRLGADDGPGSARVARGAQRYVVLRREGLWAVRVFDPDAENRRAFAGIDVFDYDERWVLAGEFRPYDASRTVRVGNADGRERGLGLGGELAFTVDGAEHTLQVAVEDDGSLWAVLADGTSGHDSYRFRFLRPPAPAADATVTVDFNRTLLPPCAFADHFICPFPPPGNTLPIEVRAGERNRLTR
ncbi:DUF1684 domain-containing protein [Streptomyces varsoviensis]|uniref:DUF1684 domain-containing protein n=1 Tax=Streptomyces varsoviensis TaxID=67373 RepID=UPI0033D03A11